MVPDGVTSLFVQLYGAGGGTITSGGDGEGGGYYGGGGGSSRIPNLTSGSFGPVVVTTGGAMNGASGFGNGGDGEIILTNDTPAAVPEASTNLSLGLLLALGLGGVAISARRRKAVAG